MSQSPRVEAGDERREILRLLVGEYQQRVLGVDDADAVQPDQGDVAIRNPYTVARDEMASIPTLPST